MTGAVPVNHSNSHSDLKINYLLLVVTVDILKPTVNIWTHNLLEITNCRHWFFPAKGFACRLQLQTTIGEIAR